MISIREFAGKHRALLLIWLIYLTLGVVYNMSLPLFEAPDEVTHFRFVSWLATERRLPDMVADLAAVGHQVWQPPLYYALVAPFVIGIDRSDLYSVSPFNEHWRAGAGINVFNHTRSEDFPYQKTTLAVHVTRLLSTLLGSLALISTYGLARLIAPSTAVLSTALVAFNPQFLFISAAVSNDVLVASLGGLAIWFLVWLLFQPGLRFWHFVALGCLWGLLTLAKLSGLAFGVVILVGLGLIAWQRRTWTTVLIGGSVALLTAVLIAGWWFVRNWLNYGDPLAWQQLMHPLAPLIRTNPISWVETFQYAAFLRKSYWAMFGHGIRAPESFYWFVLGVMTLSGVGLLVWLGKNGRRQWLQPRTQAILLLIIWSGIIFISLLRWMRLLRDTDQGRLLFPAIVSLAVLMALGLKTISGQTRWLQQAVLCVLGVWAAAFPWLTIQSAYAHPKPLPAAADLPNPLHAQFDHEIQLAGFDLTSSTVRPGEAVTIDLYWGALQTIRENYQVRLRLIDAEWHAVAQSATVPYQGRYATSLWQPGDIFRDRYVLPPVANDAVPGRGHLVVSLHPWRNLKDALPVTVDTIPVGNELIITNLKISPLQPLKYQPEQEVDANLGGRAILLGYDAPGTAVPGTSLPITLYWQALEPDGKDYTVFIHLLDANGQLVAQTDGQPQESRYPTSIWESGEQIKDDHLLILPGDLVPGQYKLFTGLYNLESGQRLPLVAATNVLQSDNRINLSTLKIH